MDDKKYDVRKPIDTPENYRMSFGLFALLGVGLIGAAVYFYFYLTQAEARGEIIVWWRGYSQLYEAYGKWGVVNFHLVIAAIFFFVSGLSFRKWRRLVRQEREKGRAANTAPSEK